MEKKKYFVNNVMFIFGLSYFVVLAAVAIALFIACLDPIGQPRGQQVYSLTPEDYGRFLCATFDDWYKDWKEGNFTSVRQFDDYIHVMTGVQPSSCPAYRFFFEYASERLMEVAQEEFRAMQGRK